MSDDLVKLAREWREDGSPPEPFYATGHLIDAMADRIEELEAKLELIQEEWHGAVYGDLENGVAVLNRIAWEDFQKRYPLVSNFGATISRIIDGGKDE